MFSPHFSPSHSTHVKQPTSFMDKDKVKFNFDEFYRAHYGDALKRQRENKRKRQEAKFQSRYYSMEETSQQMLIVGLALTVLGVGLYLIPVPQSLRSRNA